MNMWLIPTFIFVLTAQAIEPIALSQYEAVNKKSITVLDCNLESCFPEEDIERSAKLQNHIVGEITHATFCNLVPSDDEYIFRIRTEKSPKVKYRECHRFNEDLSAGYNIDVYVDKAISDVDTKNILEDTILSLVKDDRLNLFIAHIDNDGSVVLSQPNGKGALESGHTRIFFLNLSPDTLDYRFDMESLKIGEEGLWLPMSGKLDFQQYSYMDAGIGKVDFNIRVMDTAYVDKSTNKKQDNLVREKTMNTELEDTNRNTVIVALVGLKPPSKFGVGLFFYNNNACGQGPCLFLLLLVITLCTSTIQWF